MKICMVYPFEFPSLGQWEGSRSRLLSLSRGLIDMGVEVHVLSKPDPSYCRNYFDGIRLHRLSRLGSSKASKILLPFLVAKKTLQLAKRYGFELFHVHLPIVAAGTEVWKPLIHSKILFDTHDWFKLQDEIYYNFPFLPHALTGFVDYLERRIAARAHGVVVTTPLLKSLVGEKSRVFIVPNAVDTGLFKPLRSKVRYKFFKECPLVIGFLGFISIHQGVYELIKAVKIVSGSVEEVKMLAVGGGYVEDAREFARDLGIEDRIVFTGPRRVPYLEIPDIINAMDIAVSPLQPLPKYQDYAQPLKVLEYMACGRPVVVTPLKEQRRMVKEAGCGIVADGFSSTELADAILKLYSETGISRMEHASRRYAVNNHSVEIVLGNLMTTYRQLIMRKESGKQVPSFKR